MFKQEFEDFKQVGKAIASTLKDFKDRDIIWMAPIVVMIIGLFPLPYGYYTFLKIIVCPSLIYYAVKLTNVKNISPGLRWAFIVLAFIYNPILQVHLYSKVPWIVINFITAILLIMVGADREFEKRMKGFDDVVLDRKKKKRKK
jgi:hypothetical protein|tara:strand:+ start:171 stop:602 length:432 start_codon:yes stop_codon:yes gene_type:complete